MEQELSELLSRSLGINVYVQDIILDIPEPISFETNLLLYESGKPFLSGSTVFTTDTMNAFSRILRITRIFISPEFYVHIKESPHAQEALRNTGNWLHL